MKTKLLEFILTPIAWVHVLLFNRPIWRARRLAWKYHVRRIALRLFYFFIRLP